MHTGDMYPRAHMPFIDVENSGGAAVEFADTLQKAVSSIQEHRHNNWRPHAVASHLERLRHLYGFLPRLPERGARGDEKGCHRGGIRGGCNRCQPVSRGSRLIQCASWRTRRRSGRETKSSTSSADRPRDAPAVSQDTDRDWNALADIDPYWAVLTHDEFRGVVATDHDKLNAFLVRAGVRQPHLGRHRSGARRPVFTGTGARFRVRRRPHRHSSCRALRHRRRTGCGRPHAGRGA